MKYDVAIVGAGIVGLDQVRQVHRIGYDIGKIRDVGHQGAWIRAHADIANPLIGQEVEAENLVPIPCGQALHPRPAGQLVSSQENHLP